MTPDVLIGSPDEVSQAFSTIEAQTKRLRDRIYWEIMAVIEGKLVKKDGGKVEIAIYAFANFQRVMSMPVYTRNRLDQSPHNMFMSTDWLHAYVVERGGASGFLLIEKPLKSADYDGLVGFCEAANEPQMRRLFEEMAAKPDGPHHGATYHPFRM